MQTATVSISVPNSIFESAERLAQQLGLSRDELYVQALSLYLRARVQLQQGDITDTLNRVYAQETSHMPPDLMGMQVVSIGETW